ncbi:MAG: aminopeptidase P family protein [Desulfovibrio sp.]
MFSTDIYAQRQKRLMGLMAKNGEQGVLVFPSSRELPFTAVENPYPYRQNSSFLYYFGLERCDVVGVMDLSSGKRYLVGEEQSLDDIIWSGTQPSIQESAAMAGGCAVMDFAGFQELVRPSGGEHPPLHFVPHSRAEDVSYLSDLLQISYSEAQANTSESLTKAVIQMRSCKGPEEIAELNTALDISYEMYALMFSLVRDGVSERRLYNDVQALLAIHGSFPSFPPIVTVRGDILHNRTQPNTLRDGDLFLMDSGAESPCKYASDITRAFPVSGVFSTQQKDIYSIVLEAQREAIGQMASGVMFKEVHLHAVRVICAGLKALGLMKGNVDEAVAAGAHALFMPHGLGHMLGLDVHDMEEFGEDNVGYDNEVSRSSQFGLSGLRLGKRLLEGYVVTVEPGIYFIEGLIEKWRSQKLHTDYISYDALADYSGFGGIRIEDDVLVTKDGNVVLGPEIPKEISELESILAR